MLITFILWITVITISFGYGLCFDVLFKLSEAKSRNLLSLSNSIPIFFIGFVVVNVLATLLSLFLPLSMAAFLIIAVPGAAMLIYFIQKTSSEAPQKITLTAKHRWLFLISGSLLFLLVLWLTTALVHNSDSNIYHAQSIHWIESYRAIRGLGNFFNRLAYNSNWFVQNAIFSFSWFGGVSYHTLNGLLIWVVSTFFLYEFICAIENQSLRLAHWVGLFLIPLGLISIGTQASAPSTDMPAAYTAWMAGYLVMSQLQGSHKKRAEVCFTGLIMFAVVIKLSIAPLLILPVIYFVSLLLKKNFKTVFMLGAWMAVILLPWLARNAIISGYLVYPATMTVLPVEWRIPETLAAADQLGIRAWGFNSHLPAEAVLAQPISDRITAWFNTLSRNQKAFTLLSLGSPVLIMLNWGIRFIKKKKINDPDVILTGIAFFIAEVFWLFSSPNLRFGYGYLVFLAAFGLSIAAARAIELIRIKPSSAGFLAAVLMSLALAFIFSRSFDVDEFSQRVLRPIDYDTRSTVPCTINEGKQTIFCASTDECGYYAFPCHAWGNDFVRMYGDDYQDGFYSVLLKTP